MRETMIMLVSTKPKRGRSSSDRISCTVAVSESLGLLRVYNFKVNDRVYNHLHRWDRFQAEIAKGNRKGTDKREDTFRITDGRTISKIDKLKAKYHRSLIGQFAEDNLDEAKKDALAWKRTLAIIRNPQVKRIIMNSDNEVIFYFHCLKPCIECNNQPHRMICFDWQIKGMMRNFGKKGTVDELWKRVKKSDVWFVLGTHFPRRRWLLVGLIFMKKQPLNLTSFFKP